jgi:fibronectin type 3 domain-containing protein
MKRALILACLLLAATRCVHGQSLQAVTSGPGPNLKVVVTWPTTTAVSRFNLYRTPGPSGPLNSAPIARMSSCAQVETVIPMNSDDWKALSNGLAQNGSQFDPCSISTIVPGSPLDQRLQFLVRANWRIAVVAGQALVDTGVTAGTTYTYQLRGVDGLGNETGPVFPDASVLAGSPVGIAPPGSLSATAGDSRVLLLWGNQIQAAGFQVSRATSAAGPYLQVNDTFLLTRIANGIDGTPLGSPSNGFLDALRWDPSGLPTAHLVAGVAIDGPTDGITYYYRVSCTDVLGQAGPPSASVSAMPVDKTAPATPSGVTVTALDTQNQLEVRWTTSNMDVEGHPDASGVTGYKVFRYDAENAPLASGTQIGGTVPQPGAGVSIAKTNDTSPNLRPPFGEKTFWYRVQAVDANGNISGYSAAVGGHLKDITPPDPPKNLTAEGFDTYIQLNWSPNTEPDLDHYQIFRSYCHNGKCNPCDPSIRKQVAANEAANAPDEGRVPSDGKDKTPTPCTGEYVLIGSVSLSDAKSIGNPIIFRDRTIPKDSPVCYSYWIKAYDQVQNMSGTWPFPAPNEQTVCQRLRDRTPPDPAIISGLFAREGGIRVEWIAAPVQDIRAYQVYRADQETGTYKFVGGMTVEPPPALPHILTAPYQPPPLVKCDTIPLVAIDSMSMGAFTDPTAVAKRIYWYKVLGVDQSGNESPVANAVPMSTFTYKAAPPAAPVITSVTATSSAPFELVVTWTPAYDPATTRGFAVFRSDSQTSLYRQVGTIVKASEFHDPMVVKNVTYWYKVARLDLAGQVSQPSAAVSGIL